MEIWGKPGSFGTKTVWEQTRWVSTIQWGTFSRHPSSQAQAAKTLIPTRLSRSWIKSFPQMTSLSDESYRESDPGWAFIRPVKSHKPPQLLSAVLTRILSPIACSGSEWRPCCRFPPPLQKWLGSAQTHPVFPGATGILLLVGFQPFQDGLTSRLK